MASDPSLASRRRPRGWSARDGAASAVFGTMLMLALTASLIPVASQMMDAQRQALQAEREAAEHAAYCARYPHASGCDRYSVPPGYECAPDPAGLTDTIVCRKGGDLNATLPGPGLGEGLPEGPAIGLT